MAAQKLRQPFGTRAVPCSLFLPPITAEHEKDGARQQLIDGWKTWIKDRRARDQGEGGAGTASATFDMDQSVPADE